MSALKRAWVWYAAAAVADAGGALRIALDGPLATSGWMLVGYLTIAALCFGAASWRSARRSYR